MGKNLHDIWKVKEGYKTIWKVQAEKGVLSFTTKKKAIAWVNSFKKEV